jgi:hypothetical protein
VYCIAHITVQVHRIEQQPQLQPQSEFTWKEVQVERLWSCLLTSKFSNQIKTSAVYRNFKCTTTTYWFFHNNLNLLILYVSVEIKLIDMKFNNEMKIGGLYSNSKCTVILITHLA